MGIGRKASAISGGALALALSGGLPLLNTTPAQAMECVNGGGLVSGITGTLCSVVEGVTGTVNRVTDVVDGLTGGATAPVTKSLNDTVSAVTDPATAAVGGVGRAVDDALDKTLKGVGGALGNTAGKAVGEAVDDEVGEAVEETADSAIDHVGRAVDHAGEEVGHAGQTITRAAPTGSPTLEAVAEELTGTAQETCPPLLTGACAADEAQPRPEEHEEERARPTPTPSETGAGTLPIEPSRPRSAQADDRGEVVGKRVDPDNDGVIPLLWPGQKVPDVTIWPRGKQVLTAGKPHDTVGTALTTALLLSALLATRVVSTRRARAEQRESIPFEGGIRLPSRSGRHRLA